MDRRAHPGARIAWRVVPVLLALVAGLVLGVSLSEGPTPAPATSAPDTTWTCSMHPSVSLDVPGACPICGMDLIPASTTDDARVEGVVLSPRARALARLQTQEVGLLGDHQGVLHLLGRVEPAEDARRSVTAWVSGRVERLHVSTTGASVRAGQTVARVYSPELYAAHQDLLAAHDQLERLSHASDTTRGVARAALSAVEQRLQLLGVPPRELERMAAASEPWTTAPIRSPYAGEVLRRRVTQGDIVSAGMPLFEVAQLDSVWVQLDAYEQDLPLLEVGQSARIVAESVPGGVLSAEVAFVAPTVDPVRRTAEVRLVVDNADGQLRPGAFVSAQVDVSHQAAASGLVVPASAVLFTGRRSLVYVEQQGPDAGAYVPREVQLGPRLDDVYPVLSGLEAGERVVTRGAFVVDADLQLRGGGSMMSMPDDPQRRASGPIELDPAGTAQLALVLDAYLDLQAALAEDALPRSTDAASSLRAAVHAVQLRGEAAESWEALAGPLLDAAENVQRADTLANARVAFARASAHIEHILSRFGNPLEHDVHVAFCPMAFDNTGGRWVQAGEAIDNAYFGSAMRTCGEVRATVQPGGHLSSRRSASAAGSGHSH